MNQEKIKTLEQILLKQYRYVNGIMITQKGKTIFERYNGFTPTDPHNVASVTKSILSALIGIAIDQGNIKSVDQKVLEFFPEYKVAPKDTKKKSITIKHLLTMTAPTGSKSIGKRWEPLDRLRRQRDWGTYILDALGQGKPGFQYSTAGSHLLSIILTRATGLSAWAFANQYLFNPLGMQQIPEVVMDGFKLDDVFGDRVSGWIHDPQGFTVGGWGLTLTPRDMALFGQLYLNNGLWNKKQILSKEWIDQTLIPNSNNYGYLWWLKEDMYAAIGSGGNMICCIPDKQLVVTIVAKISSKVRDPWEIVDDHIVLMI